MGWPIVENVPTPCGIIFNLFRSPQLNFGKTNNKIHRLLFFPKQLSAVGVLAVSCKGPVLVCEFRGFGWPLNLSQITVNGDGTFKNT